MCNDEREKANINPFGSISHSSFGKEDLLNSLIKSAQNADCPEKDARCCSTKFISTKGKFYNFYVQKLKKIAPQTHQIYLKMNHFTFHFMSSLVTWDVVI